jgi:hypothetical protein
MNQTTTPECILHEVKIDIKLVLRIPIYIEPVVMEMPTTCAEAGDAIERVQPESATVSATSEPAQKKKRFPPLNMLWIALLAPISVLIFHLINLGSATLNDANRSESQPRTAKTLTAQ